MAQMTQLGAIQNMLPATGTATVNTGKVVPMPVNIPAVTPPPPQTAWNAVRGSLISSADPRYAWVPLYRRDGDSAATTDLSTWSAQAQVFLIPVAVRNLSTFTNTDTTGGVNSNLYPKLVNVTITDGTPDTVTFNSGATAAVVEGTYVIISDDKITGANAGRMNGRVYRVGNFSTGNTWELLPGNDFSADSGADGILGNGDDITGLTNVDAYIVGRGLTDPAVAGTYSGAPMDVAVYTGFIFAK
jgi:hypothetical protein